MNKKREDSLAIGSLERSMHNQGLLDENLSLPRCTKLATKESLSLREDRARKQTGERRERGGEKKVPMADRPSEVDTEGVEEG